MDAGEKSKLMSRMWNKLRKSPRHTRSSSSVQGQCHMYSHASILTIAYLASTTRTGASNKSNQRGSALTPNQFVIQFNEGLWPEFNHSEVSMDATGPRHVDLVESVQKRWAGGGHVDPGEFGTRLLVASALPPKMLPSRLFDLAQHQVINCSQVTEPTDYVIISHVWGDVTNISGKPYGVEWDIPVQNPGKLERVLTSARIVTGSRYIWMDVLCLDQRTRNEVEIARMKTYYENA